MKKQPKTTQKAQESNAACRNERCPQYLLEPTCSFAQIPKSVQKQFKHATSFMSFDKIPSFKATFAIF